MMRSCTLGKARQRAARGLRRNGSSQPAGETDEGFAFHAQRCTPGTIRRRLVPGK
ncbi:hypothetical protein NEE01_00360 [Sphingomonas sp. MMSM24]|uniref:Uncharacterized protein n=1 Tax=Sphingomonas lycopersici TaxID=2951807 RepID=A0AA42CN53_9SPHN|nr:hypothetical protein [Sphingomonas lycopersici]